MREPKPCRGAHGLGLLLPLVRFSFIAPLHPDGNSHSFHPDISHPEFCLADVPPSPGISHPDPSVMLIRRTSVANDSDSPDSLARQILAIRRIHFRPRCASNSSVVHARCTSGSPAVHARCTLDLSAIPTLSSWGLNHQTSRLSLLSA